MWQWIKDNAIWIFIFILFAAICGEVMYLVHKL